MLAHPAAHYWALPAPFGPVFPPSKDMAWPSDQCPYGSRNPKTGSTLVDLKNKFWGSEVTNKKNFYMTEIFSAVVLGPTEILIDK